MKLLIIADDFTGALDTGVQLSKNQVPTWVYVDGQRLPDGWTEGQVVVVNLNTRHLTPQEAYERVSSLLREAGPVPYLYVKTDSVLRGNVSATFRAALDHVGRPLYFLPAFPDLKRTTKNGTAYVDGQPLERSVFARDPRTPTLESHVPSIINRDFSIPVIPVSVQETARFTPPQNQKDGVYLFDCETTQELALAGNAIAALGGYAFCSGCAGFASTICDHVEFERTEGTTGQGNGSPCLFISGSANDVTLGQLSYAKEQGYPAISLSRELNDFLHSSLSFEEYRTADGGRFQQIADQCVAWISQGKSPLIATAFTREELLDLETLHKNGKNDEQIHNGIAQYTSHLVQLILDAMPIQNVVTFGGDMVAAILTRLQVTGVLADGEATRGVPLCHFDYKGRQMNLITKSGGFGDSDVIPKIEHYLR